MTLDIYGYTEFIGDRNLYLTGVAPYKRGYVASSTSHLVFLNENDSQRGTSLGRFASLLVRVYSSNDVGPEVTKDRVPLVKY